MRIRFSFWFRVESQVKGFFKLGRGVTIGLEGFGQWIHS